jgi:hypothetical protein
MEQFKEIVKQIYDGEINLGTIHAYFHDIFMKLLPFLIIYTIIFLISFYFILKKEGKKPWYAFIPFYNMYLYFKIIDFEPINGFVTDKGIDRALKKTGKEEVKILKKVA